jgi:hypothetical protein
MPPTPRDIEVAKGFWRQACEDLRAARLLDAKGRKAPALVEIQHAFEKCVKSIMVLQLGDGGFHYRHQTLNDLSAICPVAFAWVDIKHLKNLRQLEAWLPRQGTRTAAGHTLHTDPNTEYPWSPLGGSVFAPADYFRRRRLEKFIGAVSDTLDSFSRQERLLPKPRK